MNISSYSLTQKAVILYLVVWAIFSGNSLFDFVPFIGVFIGVQNLASWTYLDIPIALAIAFFIIYKSKIGWALTAVLALIKLLNPFDIGGYLFHVGAQPPLGFLTSSGYFISQGEILIALERLMFAIPIFLLLAISVNQLKPFLSQQIVRYTAIAFAITVGLVNLSFVTSLFYGKFEFLPITIITSVVYWSILILLQKMFGQAPIPQ